MNCICYSVTKFKIKNFISHTISVSLTGLLSPVCVWKKDIHGGNIVHIINNLCSSCLCAYSEWALMNYRYSWQRWLPMDSKEDSSVNRWMHDSLDGWCKNGHRGRNSRISLRWWLDKWASNWTFLKVARVSVDFVPDWKPGSRCDILTVSGCGAGSACIGNSHSEVVGGCQSELWFQRCSHFVVLTLVCGPWQFLIQAKACSLNDKSFWVYLSPPGSATCPLVCIMGRYFVIWMLVPSLN